MSKILKVIGVLAILFLMPKLIQKLVGPRSANASESIARSVSEMNAKLPQAVGAGTTLTRAEFDGAAVRYFYTLGPGSGFDAAKKDQYEGNMVSFVCGGYMKEVLNKGVAVVFHTTYTVSGVEQSFDTEVRPGRCG